MTRDLTPSPDDADADAAAGHASAPDADAADASDPPPARVVTAEDDAADEGDGAEAVSAEAYVDGDDPHRTEVDPAASDAAPSVTADAPSTDALDAEAGGEPAPIDVADRAARLAFAGVADHLVAAPALPADPAAEAAALTAICARIAGPVFRLRPGLYALRLADAPPEALVDAVAEAGGGEATVTPIPAPASDPIDPGLVMIGPFADLVGIGGARLVIDADLALEAARGIAGALAALVVGTATPAGRTPHDESPAPEASPEPELAARLAADLAALRTAEAERGPRLDAMLEAVRKVAERPVVTADFAREREGLARLSSAFQTILRGVDRNAGRLAEAATRAEAADGVWAGLAERLATLIARAEIAAAETAAAPPPPDLGPLTEAVGAMRAEVAAVPDPGPGLAELGRRLEALERAAAADTRLDQVLDRLAEQAERLDRLTAAAPMPEALADSLGRSVAEAVAATLAATTSGQAARLDRLEAVTLGTEPGSISAALAAQTARLEGGFTAAEDAIAPLRTQLATVEARLSVVTETLSAVAAELARAPDVRRERDGLLMFASNLQVLLSGIDRQAERLREIADGAAPLAALSCDRAALQDMTAELERHRTGLETLEGGFADHLERLAAVAADTSGAAELTADLRLALAECLAVQQRERAAPGPARRARGAGRAADAS